MLYRKIGGEKLERKSSSNIATKLLILFEKQKKKIF
jgi:hypothetical protein